MEAKDLILKKIDEGDNIRYLLLDHSNGVYAINELLYDILALRQKTEDYSIIMEEVNSKHRIGYITPSFIDQAVESTFQKILIKESRQPEAGFIKFKISIIKENQFQAVYKYLSLLFNNYVITALTAFSILSSLYFIIANRLYTLASIYQKTLYNLSIPNIAAVYILMFAIIIFHEIGHASASYHYRVKPKEIGFGFYFIFPVFYSNVTNIWQLSKNKRNVVNFGGIYFQLIINIILIVLYCNEVARPITFTLIIANNASMIGSANPFFRFDGYWIFSDSFNIPNLKSKSRNLITGFLSNKQPYILYLQQQPKALLLYSLINLAFWAFVYYSIFHYSVISTIKLYRLLLNGGWIQSSSSLADTMVTFGLTLGMLYLLLLHVSQTLKVIKNETIGIHFGQKQVG